MSLPDPFNTVLDLCTFAAFRQGKGGPSDTGESLKQSVLDGEFSTSQLEAALAEARAEIFARAGQKQNEDYDDYRAAQLQESEKYLATSRLYQRYAEKLALKFPESNLQSVGSVSLGADTPSPLEKMEVWHRVANVYRQQGETLLRGQPWTMVVGTESERDPFTCLAPGMYSGACCNGSNCGSNCHGC